MSAALISWPLRQVARLARAFAWIAAAGLALIAVLAALPSIVDAEAYKPRVAEILASASGRTVSLDGPLSFELLPQPRLVLQDVRVGNVPGAAAPTMLTARRLAVRLSWQALLQGRIEILRVELDEPRLVLEPGADGKSNWWFPVLESARGERPPLLPVTLDRVEIHGGRLVNATGLFGQPVEAHAIDLVATLDAKTAGAQGRSSSRSWRNAISALQLPWIWRAIRPARATVASSSTYATVRSPLRWISTRGPEQRIS